ncbi:MAG: hypothetical protein FWF18_04235 [Dehalococcoidia bacterium]|nr:hypothetical protein [Dehalococcoidia bacterium]
MKKSSLFVLSAVLLIAMLAAGCNGNGENSTTYSPTGNQTTASPTTSTPSSTTTTLPTNTIPVLGDEAAKLPADADHAEYAAEPLCSSCHGPGTGEREYPLPPFWAGSALNPGPWRIVMGSDADHTDRRPDAFCIYDVACLYCHTR